MKLSPLYAQHHFDSNDFTVFKRTGTTWEQLAKARKFILKTKQSYDKAKKMVDEFNNNRDSKTIKRGTRLEMVTAENFTL